jgi:hypothetical protein
MTRAVRIDIDRTYEVFDLKPYPHLQEVIGGFFDITFVLPIAQHPKQITVGLAVDDIGLWKELEINRLATSFRGVFWTPTNKPLVGVAVMIASDCKGDETDVPDWAIELLEAIKKGTDEAAHYSQNSDMN